MKTTTGKNTIQKQPRKFISKFTLPFIILCASLSANSAMALTDAERSSNQVQNFSDSISTCEKWYALVSKSHDHSPWYNLLNKTSDGTTYIEALLGTDTNALSLISKNYLSKDLDSTTLQQIMDQAAICEVYIRSTDIKNYSSDSAEKMGIGGNAKDDGSDTVNTQIVQCMSQPNQQAKNQCLQQAMQSGNMKCKHSMLETHDYLKCKNLATFVMGFAVGKSAMQLQQGFRVGNAAIDAQQQLLQKQNTKEGVGMSDTLGVQRDSLKQQGEMAYEMAAYNAAKAGILLKMISDFPTRERMYQRCTDKLNLSKLKLAHSKLEQTDVYKSIKVGYTVPSAYKGTGDQNGETAEDFCNSVLLSGSSRSGSHDKFFENQEILDKVKQMAMQAGLDAVANGAKGALLNKQAGIVDDAIKDIKTFEKPDFQQAGFDPSKTSECNVNPNAEGCITLGRSTTSGFGSQSFGSTGAGSANLGSAALSSSDTSSNNASSATKRNLLPSSVGSVQIGQGNKGGFSDPKVAAGTIKPGKGNGAGGRSGGGGGSGGAALPAGGGSPKGGQPAVASSGKSAIKVGMNGTGLGRVTGGRGAIGGRKKSSSANPFAKLLGKGKRSASTLSFRGPASQIGKSKGSLFQRISSRYKAVSKADKLLKYEAKE